MSTPFSLPYNATAGILIASALRDKAVDELGEAEDNDRMAARRENRGLQSLYELQALQARNRARIFQEAADDILKTVRAALAADMDAALTRTGE